MIKYIGSKRALVPWIIQTIDKIKQIENIRTVLDPFSGSARVGHALKEKGYYVIASDYATYAYIIAKALIEADSNQYPKEKLEDIIAYLNDIPPMYGWFTKLYAEQARFFQPFNAARIEAIRIAIDSVAGSDEILKSILLTSLFLAADKVDSTTGIHMSYLKKWSQRSYNQLQLKYPPLLPGTGKAIHADALDAVKQYPVDLVYLDPPYNQCSYLSYYHIWETLTLFDNPETYGMVNKRIDVRIRKSPYNYKKQALEALKKLIEHINAKAIILSFSNEGFHAEGEIISICQEKGYVKVLRKSHKRYIGAKIGIYNQYGCKVGTVSHLTNEERLFIISKNKRLTEILE